jgi:hypothetical protein
MIKVTVTENGQVLDELEFNESNVMHYEGAAAVIHRDIMKHCTRGRFWYRVAHAAAWIRNGVTA